MNKPGYQFGGMRHILRRVLNKDLLSPRLMLCAVMTGAITGAVCSFFEIIPALLNSYRVNFLLSEGFSVPLTIFFAFLISAFLGAGAMFLKARFAPEAGGSGIPEIEGAMVDLRPVRFWRVLPVKFLGGIMSLSSGMILGREGPSIQIGGNLGAMVSHFLRLNRDEFHVLLAAGGASGLASAFNAPLAGIMFVMEELRPQFRYNFASVQAVTLSVIASTIVRDNFSGTFPVFTLPHYAMPDLSDLLYFAFFGAFMGCMGVIFNKGVAVFQDLYQKIHRGTLLGNVLVGFFVAGIFGALSCYIPEVAGSGMPHISGWITSNTSVSILTMVLLARILGILFCFCSGIPGGIFAPSLSIGTLFGCVIGGILLRYGFINFDPGILAIVGMGAFFAASVRAPVTGIILVCEMTNNFQFLLPMLVSVFAAVIVAGNLGGSPIYTQILERTLRMSGNKDIMKKFENFKLSSQDLDPVSKDQK